MHFLEIFLATILLSFSTAGVSGGITTEQLPKVNDFAIVDNEGEQYIAATDKGLFHSKDHGHSWEAYAGFDLPATMVTTTSQGTVYAFMATKGLLLLNVKSNQWLEVNNQFGSQYLRQLSTTDWTPSRLVALNQYGKFIVSNNYGSEWSNLTKSNKTRTPEEERGYHLYVEKCQSCHGKDGVGENYSLQSLTDKNYLMAPALDASAHAWHHTDEALQKIILEGSTRSPRMAAWKNLGVSTEEAHDLVSYIKSLWTRRELECQGPKHMQCMN
jgi:mono/diheme cytochrome c family protein